MLSCCFLDFSVSVGAFVIGLGQISSLFSYDDLVQLHSGNVCVVRQKQYLLSMLLYAIVA